MICVGIDPGKSGALSMFEVDASDPFRPKPKMKAVDIIDMPLTEDRTIDVVTLRCWLMNYEVDRVFMETAHPRPNDGKPQVFASGVSFGLVQAAIRLHGLEPVMVAPQIWKRRFDLLRKNKPKNEPQKEGDKKRREMKTKARMLAIKLMPDTEKWLRRVQDDGRAESLLLAMYGAEIILGETRLRSMREASDGPSTERSATA